MQIAAVPQDAGAIPPVPPAPVIAWGVPPEAMELSKAFEGFRHGPYLCAAGVWTIGYGSTQDKAAADRSSRTPRPSRSRKRAPWPSAISSARRAS